jgi:RimJ/RimL family protein N-acetyltransferase
MSLAPLLPDDVLTHRAQLPLKPQVDTLHGKYITLISYSPTDHESALFALSNGTEITVGDRHHAAYDPEALIWRHMFAGPFATQADFAAYMQGQLNAPNGKPFTVIDNSLAHPVGVINLMNNVPDFLKVELGSIWYSPIAQRTFANLEATYLLAKWAFESGYRRVEWKCDALNERSRHSAQRMGFRYEGTQDFHMIVKNRSRDTVWFRILDHEWEEVKVGMEGLLNYM